MHGFGFAGVLSSLELPAARLVPALAGFNLGVELGQLAIVALAWPLLNALGRTAGGPRLVAVFNGAIGGLGVFWLVTRLLS
ncbi:MAG: HupE/UreJ family protein [Proteobacteria bacterium]|nr:HupE/UreJ family protein [Pseudomonadota bacterium]